MGFLIFRNPIFIGTSFTLNLINLTCQENNMRFISFILQVHDNWLILYLDYGRQR